MLLDFVGKLKGSSNGGSHDAEPAAEKSSPVTAPAGSTPAPAAPPPAPLAGPQSASPNPQKTSGHSVLGRDVEVKGSIRFSHDLRIEGRVEGDICSDGILTVGEQAVIKGEIKTRSVIILGNVEGNITTQDRCELCATATLVGDIGAGTLVIEEGATFIGQSRIGKRQNAGKTAPEPAAKPLETLHAPLLKATPSQPPADSTIRQAA